MAGEANVSSIDDLLIAPEDEYTPRDTEQNYLVREAFRRGKLAAKEEEDSDGR